MAAKEPERMKAYGLYVDSKKVGTLETSDYKLTSGDELHVTAEGIMYSDGTPLTDITGNTVVPVSGRTQALLMALLTHKYVTVQVGILEGKVHRIMMRVLEATYTTDNKTGSLKGAFKFGGGEPDIS
ncbi:MAG: hypothetical protein EOO74_06090 [Myxococcales bacterium]|nr:MAG: hypothetical protein EOO74_06090 [Myxococcales bacterium]